MNFTGFPGFPTTNYRQDPPPRVEELPETGSETRRWLEQAEWSRPPAFTFYLLCKHINYSFYCLMV